MEPRLLRACHEIPGIGLARKYNGCASKEVDHRDVAADSHATVFSHNADWILDKLNVCPRFNVAQIGVSPHYRLCRLGC